MEVHSNIEAKYEELIHSGVDFKVLKENLTLPNPDYAMAKRFGKGRFTKVESHICYLEKRGDVYLLPRNYPVDLSGVVDCRVKGRRIRHTINDPREYQQKFLDENSIQWDYNDDILIEAACGTGKTYLGLWNAVHRGRQTLVLVPTYYLANQWKGAIKKFIPTASCSVLTSQDTEIQVDIDFTIAVLDLFSVRKLPDELVENIGHVILDEAHRVGADAYIPILNEIPAKYRTALTATFRRNDGVHKILAYHFGVRFFMKSPLPRPHTYAVTTKIKVGGVISKIIKKGKQPTWTTTLEFFDRHGYQYTETQNTISFEQVKLSDISDKLEHEYKHKLITKKAYNEVWRTIRKAVDLPYSILDNHLSENCSRRKQVITLIRSALEKGRTVLFLSKRKEVLKALYKVFKDYDPALIIRETNDRSAAEEKYIQEKCRLILGVNQLAKEGLDNDRLDTLIIHLPMKDTEQAIGRIARLHPDKKFPTAIYLLDDTPITVGVFSKAQNFIKINSDFKGFRTVQTINTVL